MSIEVEITDAAEFHCFRLVLHPHQATDPEGNPMEPEKLEILLHASAMVELIHECSVALCEWQRKTSAVLLEKITGLTPEELRERGLVS